MIKSTTRDQIQEDDKELSYPVLMIDSNSKFIVLFYGPVNGVVIHSVDSELHEVGTHLNHWHHVTSPCWRKYEGVVEICNQT